MSEDNICPICNKPYFDVMLYPGAKSMDARDYCFRLHDYSPQYKTAHIVKQLARIAEALEHGNKMAAELHGWIGKREKHNGDLGNGEYVNYRQYPGVTMVRIVCEIGELTPEQALSLRDWLMQESPELERLAKEQ